jgi:hypothetical protein
VYGVVHEQQHARAWAAFLLLFKLFFFLTSFFLFDVVHGIVHAMNSNLLHGQHLFIHSLTHGSLMHGVVHE